MFITIAPGEEKFPCHEAMFGIHDSNKSLEDVTGPLCLHIDTIFKKCLLTALGPHFARIYENTLRVEFQGRGTLHVHLAIWAKLLLDHVIEGRTGTEHFSVLVPILEKMFGGRVDVQMGSGFLNYINGYTAKAADALNFTMREHLSKDKPSPWLTAYRQLCKKALALPELYHELAGLSQMVRSFQTTCVVAPLPGPLHSRVSATQSSQVLYAAYLAAMHGGSFLAFCRTHFISKAGVRPRLRGQSGRHSGKDTLAVGIRFHYELCDLYAGEWAVMFLPHGTRAAFWVEKPLVQYSRFYAGVVEHLMSLDYKPDSDKLEVMADTLCAEGGVAMARRIAKVADYPGELPSLPMRRSIAAEYFQSMAAQDLVGRARDGRVATFCQRCAALELLLQHLGSVAGAETIPQWDLKISIGLSEVALSETQQEFVDYCVEQSSCDDANVADAAQRQVTLSGDPGSGKTEARFLYICL